MKNIFLKSNLVKALGIQKGDTVSVVGGGGKTSIINKLAGEASEIYSCPILITTTTNIFSPNKELKSNTILGTDNTIATVIKKEIRDKNKILTLARKRIGEEKVPNQPEKNLKRMKLKGFQKEKIKRFISSSKIVFVEADGSKGLPIKAPNKNEPVITIESNYILGVIGLDAIGLPVSKKNVFRLKHFCKVTGLKERMKISPESLAFLINHPNGIFQNTPKNSKKAIILNKADCIDKIDEIEKIAYIINERGDYPFKQSDRLIVTSSSWKSSLLYMHDQIRNQ